MRLKKYIVSLIFLAFSALCVAQNGGAALHFPSTTIDIGIVKEDGGSVTRYVEAINRGCAPIYIDDVVVSCGCTTAEYPREAIAPGVKVQIGVTFDPLNRPGRVEKDVWVKERGCDVATRLTVVGYVEPRERSVEEIYPFDMGGGLRLRTTSRAFGYLMQGCEAEERIEYVNTSAGELTLEMRSEVSSGMLTVEYPRVVAPGASGSILLRYSLPDGEAIYGTLSDQLRVIVGGEQSRYMLTAEAIAIDNFDATTDISAPRGEISKNIIKFGEVNGPNDLLTQSLELKNVGDAVLEVRSVECSDAAISCDLRGGVSIVKGVTSNVTITLDCSKIANPDELFTARIRIITSDPLRPMLTVKVTAIPAW